MMVEIYGDTTMQNPETETDNDDTICSIWEELKTDAPKKRRRRLKYNIDFSDMTPEEIERRRKEIDAERKKTRRRQMNEEEREAFLQRENLRKRLQRLQPSFDQQREREAKRKREKRAAMSDEDREAFRQKDAERKRRERKRRSLLKKQQAGLLNLTNIDQIEEINNDTSNLLKVNKTNAKNGNKDVKKVTKSCKKDKNMCENENVSDFKRKRGRPRKDSVIENSKNSNTNGKMKEIKQKKSNNKNVKEKDFAIEPSVNIKKQLQKLLDDAPEAKVESEHMNDIFDNILIDDINLTDNIAGEAVLVPEGPAENEAFESMISLMNETNPNDIMMLDLLDDVNKKDIETSLLGEIVPITNDNESVKSAELLESNTKDITCSPKASDCSMFLSETSPIEITSKCYIIYNRKCIKP